MRSTVIKGLERVKYTVKPLDGNSWMEPGEDDCMTSDIFGGLREMSCRS